jgi:hypothetical protein
VTIRQILSDTKPDFGVRVTAATVP